MKLKYVKQILLDVPRRVDIVLRVSALQNVKEHILAIKYLGHESNFRDCLGLNIEMHSQKTQENKDLEHDDVFEHDLSELQWFLPVANSSPPS